MEGLTILGSTGSIGVQACDVVRMHGLRVAALTGYRNVSLLEAQSREFRPSAVAASEECYSDLKLRLADTDIKVLPCGEINAIAACTGDTVLNAITGFAGFLPSLAAVKAGKTLALANKESMVSGGDIVNRAAEAAGAKIIPVDSEHSAIYQCLDGNRIKKILLTASGGPFFGLTAEQLRSVTPERALAHPVWNMGKRVTVDSATLMNKGLELIEAVKLFGVSPDRVEVLVHRQSVVHSMVEYEDNVVIAQCGVPDMRTCIQYALTTPVRRSSPAAELDFASVAELTFARPDEETFPLLSLCREAVTRGGNLPAAVNAADEEAVAAFISGKTSFTGIFGLVRSAYEKTVFVPDPGPEEIIETDLAARQSVREDISR